MRSELSERFTAEGSSPQNAHEALLSAANLWLESPPLLSDVQIVALHAAMAKVQCHLEAVSTSVLQAGTLAETRLPPRRKRSRDAAAWPLREACAAEPQPAQQQQQQPVRQQQQQACAATAAIEPQPHGELVILGSGIKAMAHLTREAMVHLCAADVVFGALNPTGPDRRWLELTLGRPIVDLCQFYPESAAADRRAAYVQGAEAVLREVRCGRRVAVVEYGHPTCCVAQSEILLRAARAEGHAVVVLPGVSCVDALWADLGIDPSAGFLLATADALLDAAAGAALRAALGPSLPHLAVLMPEAAADTGSGADVACGRASLADSAGWLDLLGLLQRAYGEGARCVLHRAPTWASVREASLLSVPLAALRCRSCVDRLVLAWGGDLGTMYLHGEGGDGGDGGDGGVSDGGGGGVAAEGIAAAEAAAGGGYDAEHRAWMRRWAIVDVKHAAWCSAPVSTHLGPLVPRAAVPPECGFALHTRARALRGFDAPQLRALRDGATPAEAAMRSACLESGGEAAAAGEGAAALLGAASGGGAAGAGLAVLRGGEEGGGGGGAQGYLRERARWEPSDAAIRLQQAFAACPRADADASVTALAERLAEAQPEAAWSELARDTVRVSALYGQPGLPESGAGALWGRQAPALPLRGAL